MDVTVDFPRRHQNMAAGRLHLRVPSLRTVGILCAAITILLVADGMLRERGAFDYRVINTIQRVELPYLEPVLRLVSGLTSSFWAITLWAVIVMAFAAARRWLPALAIAVLPLGGAINFVIGQALVQRSRPDPLQLHRAAGEIEATSFPSGHVVGAVLLYGMLVFLARRWSNAAARLTTQTASVVVISLVGLSRVWLGAHWVSDVLAAYALGGLLLVALLGAYLRIAAAVGDIPFLRAAPIPHDESAPHAHALTSTVIFNGSSVTKIYAPGFVPRAIYWLAFQAPFPYMSNHSALQAAVLRRNLAGLLTEYWYGTNHVARALGVDSIGGRRGLTSERIAGQAPRDDAAARRFLLDLCDRFDAAGLPTWQVDPRQPRALDNILETPGGDYVIIDLESGLVSPLASPRAWWRAVRRGQVPLFDDVFFDLTRAYVEREAAAMRAAGGDAWLQSLRAVLDQAEAAACAWHAAEPRIWSTLFRGAWSGFGVRRWPEWIAAKVDRGRIQANDWLDATVSDWHSAGRISAEEASALRAEIASPTFQEVMPHFGVHLLLSLALRFPLGSIARAAWTVGHLSVATLRLLTRRIDRQAWRRSAVVHSPVVIALALVPGFGTFAYLGSKPVRSNHLLMRIALDATLPKIPLRLYERTRLQRLVRRESRPKLQPATRRLSTWRHFRDSRRDPASGPVG